MPRTTAKDSTSHPKTAKAGKAIRVSPEKPIGKNLSRQREPKAPKNNGRPSIYTQELADLICAELAGGKSMRTVCKQDDMPAMDTVFRWLREKPGFSEQYTKAKAESADALVEEMIDIADNGENDWMLRHGKDKEESWVVNGEHVQRSRLRVETRKWISAKLKPKKYGDKLDMNHGVQPDNPLAKLLEQVTGTKFQVKDE